MGISCVPVSLSKLSCKHGVRRLTTNEVVNITSGTEVVSSRTGQSPGLVNGGWGDWHGETSMPLDNMKAA